MRFGFSSSYSFLAIVMLWIVFDEHVRRGKIGGVNSREMDFESFLDFVLAQENKDTPEGLTYLFRCLDLNGRGYLTTADIHSLFRWASSSVLGFLCGLEPFPFFFWATKQSLSQMWKKRREASERWDVSWYNLPTENLCSFLLAVLEQVLQVSNYQWHESRCWTQETSSLPTKIYNILGL